MLADIILYLISVVIVVVGFLILIMLEHALVC